MCICINGLMFYLLNTYTALHFRPMAIGGGSEFVEDPRGNPRVPEPRGSPRGSGRGGENNPKIPGARGWSKSIPVASLITTHISFDIYIYIYEKKKS